MRQRVPELLQSPESKKPRTFVQGFNDGASTRDRNARSIRRDTPACSANLIQQPRSKKPRTFVQGFNDGASTRDRNARSIRRDTPACSANLIQQPRSKKPRTFVQGFNDGASTRDRTRDTRIFNPLLYQLSYRGETRLRYKRFRPVLLWVRIKRISA